jgi:hypothetical protein
MEALIAAVVSAITAIVVSLLSSTLTSREQRRAKEHEERQRVNAKYLNPLRFYLVENHVRLSEILHRVESGGDRTALILVDDPEQVSSKDSNWFNGAGHYLASSVYLTACLFAHLKKVREDIPYLRLQGAEDTRLAELMLTVHLGFSRHHNVYYISQPSIGEDMWLRSEDRVRTYREFCALLRDPSQRVWLDRLIDYFLKIGNGHQEQLELAHDAVVAIRVFTDFLDTCVDGGRSIQSRWEAEERPLPKAR